MLTGKVKTNPYSRLSSFMPPLFFYSLLGPLYSYSFFTPGWPCPSLHLISLLSVSHLLFLHSPFQVSSFFSFKTLFFEAILWLSDSAFVPSTPHTRHHAVTAFSPYLLTLAREAGGGWPVAETCATTWRQPYLHLVLSIKEIIHMCLEATDPGALVTSWNNLPKMPPNEGLVLTVEPNAFVLCQECIAHAYHFVWVGLHLPHVTT